MNHTKLKNTLFLAFTIVSCNQNLDTKRMEAEGNNTTPDCETLNFSEYDPDLNQMVTEWKTNKQKKEEELYSILAEYRRTHYNRSDFDKTSLAAKFDTLGSSYPSPGVFYPPYAHISEVAILPKESYNQYVNMADKYKSSLNILPLGSTLGLLVLEGYVITRCVHYRIAPLTAAAAYIACAISGLLILVGFIGAFYFGYKKRKFLKKETENKSQVKDYSKLRKFDAHHHQNFNKLLQQKSDKMREQENKTAGEGEGEGDPLTN